jgi:Peptidase family M23
MTKMNSFLSSAPIIDGVCARIIEFPLRGEWVALRTPRHRIPTHGTNFLAQRYAYDFTQIDEDVSPLPKSKLWSYFLATAPTSSAYAWDAPVHAPAAGLIVTASDGSVDRQRLNFFIGYIATFVFPPRLSRDGLRALVGNHLIIEAEVGYVLLAHLRNGSLKVGAGQHVSAGDVIGHVGNSGNTTLPHLHIQLMDGPDPLRAAALPCAFARLEISVEPTWQPLADGMPPRLRRIRYAENFNPDEEV